MPLRPTPPPLAQRHSRASEWAWQPHSWAWQPVPVGVIEQPQLGAPPGLRGPVWAPLSGAAERKSHAAHMLAFLNMAEGSKAVNPHWGNLFWGNVAALASQAASGGSPISADLMRLMESHGYVGHQTVSPPRHSMRQELEAFGTRELRPMEPA